MLSNPYFDTLLALIFIYALLSTLVSLLNEWLNHFISSRGTFLKDTINKMLYDPINQSYGYLLYQHPVIDRFRKDTKSLPQYISAESFAIATIETIAEGAIKDKIVKDDNGVYKLEEGPRVKDTVQRFVDAVEKMGHSDLKKLLRYFLERSYDTAKQSYNIELLKKELANWFNEHMDRASGWYKTRQRPKLIFLGFVVAIAMNVDSIHLARVLMINPELRAKFVTEAEHAADVYSNSVDSSIDRKINSVIDTFIIRTAKDTNKTHSRYLGNTLTQLKKLSDSTQQAALDKSIKMTDQMVKMGLPIGWQEDAAPVSWEWKPVCKNTVRKLCFWRKKTIVKTVTTPAPKNYFSKRNKLSFSSVFVYLIGIIISAISLSFGAPFWFDILIKFVNIRRAGNKPAELINQSTKK